MSSPDVPITTSMTVVPALVAMRPHVTVPVASADVSEGIAEAVATPLEAAPKAGSENVSVASSVCAPSAVSASVGIVAVYILSVPAPAPPSMASTTASQAADATAFVMRGSAAIWCLQVLGVVGAGFGGQWQRRDEDRRAVRDGF